MSCARTCGRGWRRTRCHARSCSWTTCHAPQPERSCDGHCATCDTPTEVTQVPYEFTETGKRTLAEVKSFMTDHIYPNEREYAEQLEEVGPTGYPPIMDKLKAAARERGLWNLFLPHLQADHPGTKLSNLDYAPISEELGKVGFASEALNCSAPDTGNMEVLNLNGSDRSE